MAKARGASWKQRQLSAMRYLYRPIVERWETEAFVDDRRVFCNMYRMIEAGLKSLVAEPDLYIRNAVGAQLRKDKAMMDRIVRRFGADAGREETEGGVRA